MKVKQNLSIEDDLLTKAKKKAAAMGFNFSAYITYLINRDLSGETAATTEPPKKTPLSDKQKSAISWAMGD